MKFSIGLLVASVAIASVLTPSRALGTHSLSMMSALVAAPQALPTTKLTRVQLKEYLEIAKQGSITTTVTDDTFEALGDLIDRFFDSPRDLSKTERLMLEAFFGDAKAWFDGADNDELGGPRDPSPQGTSAMFAASTAVTAAPSPTPSKPAKPAPKVKVPGVHVKPTFSSGVRGSTGYVRLAISGRSKEIIQIRASAGGKDLSRRASMIRDRFREAQAGSGLWWSRLYVTREQGEWVVRSKSYKKVFLVTADANWAKARKMSTQQLANAIMADIRRTMDQ